MNGVSLDFTELVVHGVSVRTWSSGFSAETREAIDFATDQGIKCLVKEYTLETLEDAIEAMNNCTIRFRPVINFNHLKGE